MLLQEVALGLKALLDHPNTKGYLIGGGELTTPTAQSFVWDPRLKDQMRSSGASFMWNKHAPYLPVPMDVAR